MRYIVLFFFLLALGLGPFYVFPSGYPQPTDAILSIWMAVMFLSIALLGRGRIYFGAGYAPIIVLFFLVLWTVIVSLANSLAYGDPGIGYPSLFYIFNFLVFTSIFAARNIFAERHRKYLLWAMSISAAGVLIALLLNFEAGAVRQAGAFNNPNQLAHYSLLLACCAVVLIEEGRHKILLVTLLSVSALGVLSSSSLSAMAALAFVIAGAVIKFARVLLTRKLFVIVGASLLAGAVMPTFFAEQLSSQLGSRINVIDRKMSNVEESRGYNRIYEFPEQILLGAGERGRWRFGAGHEHELHSSFGTILFSYGIVGFVLFSTFLYMCLRKARLYALFLTAAPLLYSLTHMGLRTTLFWIFLAIVVMYAQRTRQYSAPAGRTNERHDVRAGPPLRLSKAPGAVRHVRSA